MPVAQKIFTHKKALRHELGRYETIGTHLTQITHVTAPLIHEHNTLSAINILSSIFLILFLQSSKSSFLDLLNPLRTQQDKALCVDVELAAAPAGGGVVV